MESQGSLCLLWALLACYLFSFSVAYNSFYVGGNDGWVINPSESYNHWAERNRFQVNDSLGKSSVLAVDFLFLIDKIQFVFLISCALVSGFVA
jgi:hypothetical protein